MEEEKMSKFINLTPHEIIIQNGEKTFRLEPSGIVARVITEEEYSGKINGVDVITRVKHGVEGIPVASSGDTYYIVSSMVLEACDRPDVFAPDTGVTAIRNDKGQVVAVTRLVMA